MKRVLESVADLIDVATCLIKKQGAYTIWWRGHADAGWALRPGIYRDRGVDLARECGIVHRFMRQARTRYSRDCPGRDDRVGWLSLMQHFRLPTRLLDWSESPLVAAYFAACGEEGSDACIYALYPLWLNLAQSQAKGVFPAYAPETVAVVAPAFFDEPCERGDRIIAIETDEIDTRQLIQQSRFTLHGSDLPLDEVTGSECFLFRFKVPAAAKKRIQHELYMLGIRESYLYPDLEHLSMELRSTKLVSAERARLPRTAEELSCGST